MRSDCSSLEQGYAYRQRHNCLARWTLRITDVPPLAATYSPTSLSDCRCHCCCCCLCVCRLANWEVRDMLHKVEEDLEEAYSDPSFLALELLHKAAFSGGLANGSYPDPASLHGMTGDVLREYVKSAFTAANMAVTAVGVPLGDLQRVRLGGVVCSSAARIVGKASSSTVGVQQVASRADGPCSSAARMVGMASSNTVGVQQVASHADGPVVVRGCVPLVLQLVAASWELTFPSSRCSATGCTVGDGRMADGCSATTLRACCSMLAPCFRVLALAPPPLLQPPSTQVASWLRCALVLSPHWLWHMRQRVDCLTSRQQQQQQVRHESSCW
jgi:hypothetical protein